MPCLDFEIRLLGTAILSTQPFVERPCFEPIFMLVSVMNPVKLQR